MTEFPSPLPDHDQHAAMLNRIFQRYPELENAPDLKVTHTGVIGSQYGINVTGTVDRDGVPTPLTVGASTAGDVYEV